MVTSKRVVKRGGGVKSTEAIKASAAPKLSKEELPVFNEALRRGEEARNKMESALVEYGSWLLVHVFGGDTTAALEHRKDNNIWMSLVARAGGKTLRVSQKFLTVAVRIAAYDKRLQSDSWKLLEPGRKELLLPLRDEALLREAAEHVVDSTLGMNATRDYVNALREKNGADPVVRVTVPKIKKMFSGFRSQVTDKGFLQRIGKLAPTMDADEKKALKDEARALEAALAALRKKLDE